MRTATQTIKVIKNIFSQRLFYKNTVWLLKRKSNKKIMCSINEQLIIKPITNENVTDCREFEDEKYVEIYQKMLKEGQYGYFAYLDGKPCGRIWIKNITDLNEGSWKKHLDKESRLLHYSYVAEWAREKGVHTNLIYKAAIEYINLDIYGFVKGDNIGSLRGFYKCGFIPTLQITEGYFLLIPFWHTKKLREDVDYQLPESVK